MDEKLNNTPRLIERAFPLKQTSLDSVHEKNVRHGHISTLHIWPARRPLAACRAALIATLLPDPGTPEKRLELCERIGGRVVKRTEHKKMPDGRTVDREKETTEGGILHWKRETENKADMDWFRQEIRKAYGGRAPKVLDPFAGGGAIPLEAMRLGCEATAVDINPVAWFILKCTLEYPQRLAGKTHPLPDFILHNEEFMESFYKAHPHLVGRTKHTKKQAKKFEGDLFLRSKEDAGRVPKGDLAWHVRAWGQWVLQNARQELASYYPTYAEFEPIAGKHHKAYEKVPMRLVPLREDGTVDEKSLNAEFSEKYLGDKSNPRWIAKPTVAYLWARTVTCKNCRATVPLLKTRWLCKKDNKRVLLAMEPNPDRTGVVFGVELSVPAKGGNAAQKREHDKRIGAGTMSRSGAKCPCCGTIMTGEDMRIEGKAGRLGVMPTALVTDSQTSKTYRLPTVHEIECATHAEAELERVFADIPFGLPTEPIAAGGNRAGGGSAFTVHLYGFDQWMKLFTSRQLLALGTLVKWTRRIGPHSTQAGYPQEWLDAITAGMAIGVDRIADRQSSICRWDNTRDNLQGTFTRFALPMMWDYCEGNPFSETTGNYAANLEWVAECWEHIAIAGAGAPHPRTTNQSAIQDLGAGYDAIVTDPPYYDAIPYSDLMDFFYVWLRRTLHGTIPELAEAFNESTSPKWDHEARDGELIDDSSRHKNDRIVSKNAYEDGMARVFQSCHHALNPEGRLVVVFAHKHPDAWETLVSAIIRAGFVVDGSWPIQTEMGNRTRAMGSAALSSSVWLVCKKRPEAARPGWDNHILEDMRHKIGVRLREFWDAGIRGPDFVWAATGPAMEAYSAHPVVKKANEPGLMTVTEFLGHVRRIVVDFVVGRVLAGDKDSAPELSAGESLDEPTAYYLLHRHDFGLEEAPAGACILYAISCGLSDKELAGTWDLIGFSKGKAATEGDEAAEADADAGTEEGAEEDSGSKVKLKTWAQRKGRSLGYEAPSGRPIPLIDRVHRLMHLWQAGDVHKVDEYIDANGLRRQELFKRLLQSLIELSPRGSEERSLLESLSNHIQAKGGVQQVPLGFGENEG